MQDFLRSRIFRKIHKYWTDRDVLQVSNIKCKIAALRVSERKRVVYLMAEILPVSLPRLEICSWCRDIKFSVSFHLNRDFMTKVPRIRKDQFVVLLIRLKVRDRRVGHGASSEQTEDRAPTFWRLKNEAGKGGLTVMKHDSWDVNHDQIGQAQR